MQDPHQRIKEGKDKADNKAATMALLVTVGAVALVFGFIALANSGDKPDYSKKKEDRPPVYDTTDYRPDAPQQESTVPMWLATQFMIHLANDEPDEIGELMWWDKVFERIDNANNIDEAQQYTNVDEAEKELRREKYLFKVMDPDYVELTRTHLLERLIEGDTADVWGTHSVEADWGNISMQVKDRGKLRLEVLIKTELMPGYDTVRDVNNKDAWRIVGLAHEQHGKIKDGRRVRTQRKDFGDDFYKKPKKKRKTRRGPAGPPEADPKIVAYLDGTSAEMKSRIGSLAAKTVDDNDVRNADMAKTELITLGKMAIPGVLNTIVPLNFKDDRGDIMKTFQLCQVLREITGITFKYSPGSTGLGFGRGGMTRSTPEERVKAIRRWFGWWEKEGVAWDGTVSEGSEDETWEEGEADKSGP